MSDFIISLIRTWVPKLVGLVIGALGVWAADIDSTQLTVAIVALIEALYYGLVRWLETRYPSVGRLLGYRKPPTY